MVERSYGLLKRRFPILHFGMQIKRLDLVQKIVSTCCCLHNICIDVGDIAVDDFEELPPEEVNVGEGGNANAPPAGQMAQGLVRDEIVNIFAQRMCFNPRNQ